MNFEKHVLKNFLAWIIHNSLYFENCMSVPRNFGGAGRKGLLQLVKGPLDF